MKFLLPLLCTVFILVISCRRLLGAPSRLPAYRNRSPSLEIDAYLSPFIASYAAIPGCQPNEERKPKLFSPFIPSAVARRLNSLPDILSCQVSSCDKEKQCQGSNLRTNVTKDDSESPDWSKLCQNGPLEGPLTPEEEDVWLDSVADLIVRHKESILRESASETLSRNTSEIGEASPEGRLESKVRRSLLEQQQPPINDVALERVQQMVRLFLGDLNSISSVVGLSEIALCVWAELRSTHQYDDFGVNVAKAKDEGDSDYPNLGRLICTCQSLSFSQKGRCSAINSAMLAFGCVTEVIATCPFGGALIPPTVPQGVELKLQSLPITPDKIPTDVILAEASTYRNLMTAILTLYNRVGRYPCRLAGTQGDNKPEAPLLEGWSEIRSFIAVEEGISNRRERLPLAVLAIRPNVENPELDDYLVIIRGTFTEGEWRLNFAFDQISGEFLGFPGGVHRGFASIALVLWPALQSLLGAEVQRGRLGYVTVTGHSLGGGAAAILAYLIGAYVPEVNPTLSGPTTRAVLFAPPLAGSPRFVKALAEKVNLRTIMGELDPVTAIPCMEISECESMAGIKGSGPKVNTLLYAKYPGSILFKAKFLGSPWTERAVGVNVVAWHICAYACWTSILTTAAGNTTDRFMCDRPIIERPFAANQCPFLLPKSAEPGEVTLSNRVNQSAGASLTNETAEAEVNINTVLAQGMLLGGGTTFNFDLGSLHRGARGSSSWMASTPQE